MSEPIRYSEVSNDWNGEAAGLAPSADGELVKYEDYARLHSLFANSEQENARLKAEVERLTPLLGDIVPFNEYLEEKEHAERLHIENSILMKEIARLKAEVERWEFIHRLDSLAINKHKEEIARLKAEVERLRKAGDEMHRAIKVSDPILDWKIELWNAAKEGKES